MKPIVNSITCNKSWLLVLGRKRQTVKEPMRLDHVREIQEVYYSPESISPDAIVTRSETLQLFVGGRLFGTAILAPKKKYSRFAVRLVKPIHNKRKPFEVHVTRRLMRLEGGR